MPLSFDAETHTYTLDGRRLPSVTQIIGAVMPHVWQAGEWFLNRGTQLHKACALSDQGRLDRSSVDDEILARVEAWEKFRRETSYFSVLGTEKPMASRSYLFAGTVDRILGRGESIVVCDLKSSLSCQVEVQLAAYGLLWTQNGGKMPSQAVAVELRDSGDYRAKWLTARDLKLAEQTFLACLSVYNFMNQHNLLPKEAND